MLALAQLTFRETLSRKTFMAFFITSTIFLLLLIFAFQIDVVQGGKALMEGFGLDINDGAGSELFDVTEVVRNTILFASTSLMTVGVFLSIFATANLIPTLLERGTVDLVLSKPISRTNVLLGRTLGAITVVFINVTYLIVGVWLILGFKTGVWLFSILLIIFIICFLFLILYGWMVLLGVLLRNSALIIMITYMMFGLSGFLLSRERIFIFLSSDIWFYILDGLYYLFPRTFEIIQYPFMIFGDTPMNFEALLNSLFVSAGAFSFAIFLFKRKDF